MQAIKTQERRDFIYDCLEKYMAEHGHAPTYRQLATACGFASPASAKYWLEQLAAVGWLRFEPRETRTIVLLGRPVLSHAEGGVADGHEGGVADGHEG